MRMFDGHCTGGIELSFTIRCDKCGNEDMINNKHFASIIQDGIDIDVSESCGFQGCTVDSIDIMCWKCNNEVNI